MNRKVLALYFSILAIASCQSSFDCKLETEQRVRFSMSATMPCFEGEELDTKASVSYVARIGWTKDEDKLSVINLSKGKILGGELVAAASGVTTSFSGDLLGTIEVGDKLMFVYPSQGNVSEQPFDSIDLDFSQQIGSSSSRVFISVYAISTATSINGNMTVSSATNPFSYLASYNYVALSNLPSSSMIDQITISGIPDRMLVAWDSANNQISTNPVLNSVQNTDSDGVVVNTCTSSIVLTSSNWSTNARGDLPIYFTTPYVESNTGYNRTVTVYFNDGTCYAADLFNAEYRLGTNRRQILSSFVQIDAPKTSVSVSAEMPQLTAAEGETALARAWVSTDEVSIVNLTTNTILTETLTAQVAGNSTTLAGEIPAGKVSDGDQLLLVYPALTEDNVSGADFSDNDITFDLTTQTGRLEDVPYVMTAELTYSKSTTEAVTFVYHTSVTKTTFTDILDFLQIDTESDVPTNSEGGASNQGFGSESGSWGDGTTSAVSVPVLKVEMTGRLPEDGEDADSQVTFPVKVVISSDGQNGYAVSAVESTMITLTQAYTLTQDSPDFTVYMACGGTDGSNDYLLFANVYAPYSIEVIDEYDETLGFLCSENFTIQPTSGSYSFNCVSIFGGDINAGEDIPLDDSEGGIG